MGTKTRTIAAVLNRKAAEAAITYYTITGNVGAPDITIVFYDGDTLIDTAESGADGGYELSIPAGTSGGWGVDEDGNWEPADGYTVENISENLTGKNFVLNLVSNGDFESDTDGWSSGYDGVLASVAGGKSGNCLRVTAGAGGVSCASQQITLPANTHATLTVYAKNGDAIGKVSVGETAHAWPGDVATDTNNGAWTLYTLEINVAYANPYISLWVVGSAGNITYYDEIKVTA